jgi:hypothetical protein
MSCRGIGQPGLLAQPFTVRVEASDEGGIDHVILAAGSDRGTLHRPPFCLVPVRLSEGPLTVTVTAYGASGNTSQQSATYTVRAGDPPLAGGCSLGARASPAATAPLFSGW